MDGKKMEYDEIEDLQGASTQLGKKKMRADVCELRKQKIRESIEKKKDKEEATQKLIASSIASELCNKQLSYHRSNFSRMTRRKDPSEWMEKVVEKLTSPSAKTTTTLPPSQQHSPPKSTLDKLMQLTILQYDQERQQWEAHMSEMKECFMLLMQQQQ